MIEELDKEGLSEEMKAKMDDASVRTLLYCKHCDKPQPYRIESHWSKSEVEAGFFCDWCNGKLGEIKGFTRSPEGCIVIRDERPHQPASNGV